MNNMGNKTNKHLQNLINEIHKQIQIFNCKTIKLYNNPFFEKKKDYEIKLAAIFKVSQK